MITSLNRINQLVSLLHIWTLWGKNLIFKHNGNECYKHAISSNEKHTNPPTEPVNLFCYKTQTQACTIAKLKRWNRNVTQSTSHYSKCVNTKKTKQNNRWIKSPFTLQFEFTTLWIPSFWPPEWCIMRTACCGQKEAETQRAWSVLIWQQSFMWPTYNISCKRGKNVLIMKETVWKNYLNFVKDVTMIYVHFTITVIKVSKKKIGILFHPL